MAEATNGPGWSLENPPSVLLGWVDYQLEGAWFDAFVCILSNL